jgi:hypothetical protein
VVEAKRIADEMGNGKVSSPFYLDAEQIDMARIQEVLASNLSIATKKAVLREILD